MFSPEDLNSEWNEDLIGHSIWMNNIKFLCMNFILGNIHINNSFFECHIYSLINEKILRYAPVSFIVNITVQ